MNDIDKEIAILEQEIQELKTKKEELAKLTPAQRLAIHLHDCLCHSNHTDACGWYYEINGDRHVWNVGVHRDYLDKANKCLKITDEATAMAVINAID